MKPSKVFTKWTDLEIKKTKLKKKKEQYYGSLMSFLYE